MQTIELPGPVRTSSMDRVSRPKTEAAHREAAHRVVAAMRERLKEPFSLEEMSRVGYMSPFHLNRTFRQLTGVPPTQFLYALRLEAAKELLLSTDFSVDEICHEVGYQSLGTFTRRFAQLLGAPPARLRQMAHNAQDFRAMGRLMAPHCGGTLAGRIAIPQGFSGIVFVGLFDSAIPQGKPLACAMAQSHGGYVITGIPAGRHCLFSAGMPMPSCGFRPGELLRGGGQWIDVEESMVRGRSDMQLRAPALLDPPILLTFPLLWEEMTRNQTASSLAQAIGA